LNIRSSELNIKEEEGPFFPEREDMPSSIGRLHMDHPVLEEAYDDEQSHSPVVSDERFNIIFLGESGADQRT